MIYAELEAVKRFLIDLGARRLLHEGGDYFGHLCATSRYLQKWRRPEEEIKAALCHSLYGGEDFPHALLTADKRALLREHIGAIAERTVYLYCAMDFKRFQYNVEHADAPLIKFAVKGERETITTAEFRVLMWIKLADVYALLYRHAREKWPSWVAEAAPLWHKIAFHLAPDAPPDLPLREWEQFFAGD